MAAATLLAAAPGALVAQGFMVNEHGTCVMGRAGTGVTAPCPDGSAIFYNPAGVAGATGVTMSAGVTAIKALGSFTADYTGEQTDLQNSWVPIPHFYATYGVTPQLTAGFGFFVPYGLGTKWPETFEGRFNGYDNDLRSMYFQPTVGYKLNDMLSVGVGFDFVLGAVELNQRADFSEQLAPPPAPAGTRMENLGIPFHTEFADAGLKATGATGMGGNFGVLFSPGEGVTWGVRYLTRVKLDYEGDVIFNPVPTGIVLPAGNPFGAPAGTSLDDLIASLNLFGDGQLLADQTAQTSLTMPDQLTIGVSVAPSAMLRFLAEWQWVNWSVFDTLVVNFSDAPDRSVVENYQDTNGFRMGFEWMSTEKVTLRGGYLYHQGAAPPESVTPLLPEGDRSEYTAGLGVHLTDRLTLDLAYQYLKQNDRRGRVREPAAGEAPSVALNSGLYAFNGHLIGTTLTVRF
jgi:long-chain fatty acid transport protein